MQEEITVEKFAAIAQLSDGTIRQVVLTKDETTIVENLVAELHGGDMKISHEILHGVTLSTTSQNQTDAK